MKSHLILLATTAGITLSLSAPSTPCFAQAAELRAAIERANKEKAAQQKALAQQMAELAKEKAELAKEKEEFSKQKTTPPAPSPPQAAPTAQVEELRAEIKRLKALLASGGVKVGSEAEVEAAKKETSEVIQKLEQNFGSVTVGEFQKVLSNAEDAGAVEPLIDMEQFILNKYSDLDSLTAPEQTKLEGMMISLEKNDLYKKVSEAREKAEVQANVEKFVAEGKPALEELRKAISDSNKDSYLRTSPPSILIFLTETQLTNQGADVLSLNNTITKLTERDQKAIFAYLESQGFKVGAKKQTGTNAFMQSLYEAIKKGTAGHGYTEKQFARSFGGDLGGSLRTLAKIVKEPGFNKEVFAVSKTPTATTGAGAPPPPPPPLPGAHKAGGAKAPTGAGAPPPPPPPGAPKAGGAKAPAKKAAKKFKAAAAIPAHTALTGVISSTLQQGMIRITSAAGKGQVYAIAGDAELKNAAGASVLLKKGDKVAFDSDQIEEKGGFGKIKGIITVTP